MNGQIVRVTIWWPGFQHNQQDFSVYEDVEGVDVADGVLSFWTNKEKKEAINVSGMAYRIEYKRQP